MTLRLAGERLELAGERLELARAVEHVNQRTRDLASQ
jgi:hypothetical protein